MTSSNSHGLVREAVLSMSSLKSEGQEYVLRTIDEDPSRIVRATAYSSSSRFPSRKMGQVLEAESRTVEFPFYLCWEFDADVLGVYSQPPSISIEYCDPASSRRIVRRYRPDCLVVRTKSVELVEFKTLSELESKAAERPDLWRLHDGKAEFLPLTRWASSLGIVARILHPQMLNPTRVANFRSLYAFFDRPPSDDELCLAALAKTRLDDIGYVRLVDVESVLGLDPKVAWRLIAWDQLQINIDDALLGNTDCAVCASGEIVRLLREAQNARWARIPLALPSDNEKFPDSIAHLSEAELQIAVARIHRADRLLCSGRGKKTRTDHRLVALRRAHPHDGPRAILAFALRWRLCGNRERRTSPTDEKRIADHLEELKDARCLAVKPVHNAYKLDAKENGLYPVSYETFRLRSHAIDPAAMAKDRSGTRAHAAALPPILLDHRELPPQDPWARAHSDSTETDLVCLDSSGTRILGKIWVTKMVSSSSLYPLALVPHFLSASNEVMTMLFRDCVMRWGRLPREIVVDDGGENRGLAIDAIAARFGAIKTVHCVGNPRHGSQVELSFGMDAKLFLYRQYGNTQNNKRGRAASASAKGEAHAWLRVDQAFEGFEEFVFHQLVDRPYDSLNGLTPRETFSRGCALYPCSDGDRIEYNDEFLARTSIPISGHNKVHPGKGIKRNRRWYWATALNDADVRGKKVEIREEPHDRTMLYALVNGRLVICTSSGHVLSKTMSNRGRLVHWLDHQGAESSIVQKREEHDIRLAAAQREFARTVAAENGADKPNERRDYKVPPRKSERRIPSFEALDLSAIKAADNLL